MLFAIQLLGIAAAAAATATVLSRRNKLPGKVRVTYWAGRGKCEPLRCILAAGNVKFENRFFTAATGKQELAKLRAAGLLSYDQVPLVEMDGLNLVQGAATAVYLGTRLGLMPADVQGAYAAQHVFASSQDAVRKSCSNSLFLALSDSSSRNRHVRISTSTLLRSARSNLEVVAAQLHGRFSVRRLSERSHAGHV